MDAKTNNEPGYTEAVNDQAVDLSLEEGAPSAEQIAEEINSFELVLSKPIQAHGEEVRVLHWREPTGGDIERAGNPVSIDLNAEGKATVGFNEKKMAAMISVLCQLPPSSVRQLTAKDWNGVAWKLFRFFTPPGA